MINQINVGVIGTGWCGGIRANACADNPLVDKLYIAENNKNRLQELKKSLELENATDNEDIAARAPKNGARSQKPQTFKVGFSYKF